MLSEQIGTIIDDWIAEERLPSNPCLKVIHKFSDIYPDDWDEDEFEAYWEFIAKGLAKDYEPLLSLPRNNSKPEFWPFQIDEYGYDHSPFNTVDFRRLYPPLKVDKELYRVRKVYERVKYLAETYSCITQRPGKRNTYNRFKALVETEFKDWATWTIQALKKTRDTGRRKEQRQRLFKLSIRIQKCNEIWREYAYRD